MNNNRQSDEDLRRAASSGDAAKVRTLLDDGAGVNATIDRKNYNPALGESSTGSRKISKITGSSLRTALRRHNSTEMEAAYVHQAVSFG